jgi:hypothetical protein
MNTTSRLCLTGAFLIAGCTNIPMTKSWSPLVSTDCGHGTCKAEVSIWDCSLGYISVAPDTIEVLDSQTTPKKKIEWTIVGNYRFPQSGGIQIAGDFLDPEVTPNGKKLTLRDEAGLGIHKYIITVVRESDGTSCKARDPFILNR